MFASAYLRVLPLLLLLAATGCQLPGRSEPADAFSATGGRPGQQMVLSKQGPQETSSPLWKKPFDATSDLVAASRDKLSELGSDRSDAGNQRARTSRKPSPQKDIEGMLAMARLVERRGETEKAKQMYEAILAKSPAQPVALHRLAVVTAQEGKLAEAEQLLTQAAEAGPQTAELLNDLGYICFLSRQFSEAEQHLRSALQLEPDYDAARVNFGLVLGMQGKTELAMSEFRSAVSESQAQANLAFVYAQLGDLDSAQKHYLVALDLDNELMPAAEALVQLDRFGKMRENYAKRQQQESGAGHDSLLAEAKESTPVREREVTPADHPVAAAVKPAAKTELIWKPTEAVRSESTATTPLAFAPPPPPGSAVPEVDDTQPAADETPKLSTPANADAVVQANPWIKKRPAPVVDGETYRRKFKQAPVFKGSIQTAVADEQPGTESKQTKWASYDSPTGNPATDDPAPQPAAATTNKTGRFGPPSNLDVFRSFLPTAGRPGLPTQKAEPIVRPATAGNAPETDYPMRRATWMGSRQPLSKTGLPTPSDEAAGSVDRPAYNPGW